MSNNDPKGSRTADASKRRPSIEESPTLQKPVYIISKNMNSPHILQLAEAFDKQKIAYQMQQETSTLGFKLNQRFFVIVDNKCGEVTLGPQFGSIVMTIVGYPRLGKNKKNKYFQTPAQVIAFYQHFKNGNDISDRQKSLIQSQYTDVVLENAQTNCKINSKIMMRSISKYKGQQKLCLKDKASNIKDKDQLPVKLIILEDKSQVSYATLCDELLSQKNPMIEKSQNMESVRKKTLFHTNKTQIYYLVNSKQEKELVKNIFIGQVIVFQGKLQKNALNTIVNQPKIYAIACDTNETYKILQKIGVLRNDQSKVEYSKIVQLKQESVIPAVETVKKKVEQSIILQKQATQVQQKKKQPEKKVETVEVQQLSKIQGNHSQIAHPLEPSQLDTSIISQASSKSRKVKKLRKKAKISGDTPNQSQYYDTNKKQNQNHKVEGGLLKRKLNTKQSLDISLKSKKSLTFFDDVSKRNSQQMKKIKSISKCQPYSVMIETQSNATMTQNQYFPIKTQKKSLDLTASLINNDLLKSSFSNYSKLQRDNGCINAIFYRQFIPKFNRVIDAIKAKPSSIFCENYKMQIYQPFLNARQFDRLARKIKRKLKQKGHSGEQFKFVVFLLKDQLAQFQKYCFDKNNLYQLDENDMTNTFKSNMSSMLSAGFSRMSMCVFTDADVQTKGEVSDFSRIKLFKYSLTNLAEDVNLSKLLSQVREKLVECKMIQNSSQYLRS